MKKILKNATIEVLTVDYTRVDKGFCQPQATFLLDLHKRIFIKRPSKVTELQLAFVLSNNKLFFNS